jgi:S1-C subfamily serine protease
MTPHHVPRRLVFVAGGLLAALLLGVTLQAVEVPKKVLEAEAKRVAAIEKAAPSVVAVITGGGSGVLISDDGYCLTNFHVVEAAHGAFMKCGLPDGVLYDAILVGLDKVGDVALIKLFPKKEGDKIVAPKGGKFPFAVMGDSDKLQAGDWSLAMGNPFLLATDFTPTVTFGMVSGVERYQYPAGTLLEYTNCIQIDTSINPGNSGGPLFNMDGELVGINGRGSFEKRGRVNSGVGYAISINQIKNFLGQLKAGMDTDHASLGARVESDNEEGVLSKVIVKSMIACDAARRGLDTDDEIKAFAGKPVFTVNRFKNVLGLFPRGWRVPLTFRHEEDKKDSVTKEVLVRLMGVMPQELGAGGTPIAPAPPPPAPPAPGPGPGPRPPGPGPIPGPGTAPPPPALAKMFEAKLGFANYYFNKLQRDRLLGEIAKFSGDFRTAQGTWRMRAGGTLYAENPRGKPVAADIAIKYKGAKDAQNDLIQGVVDGIDYTLEPLSDKELPDAFQAPLGSGGFLMALYHYRQFFAYGEKGFVGHFTHGGIEPFYPPGPIGEKPNYAKQRVDCEVIRTQHANVPAKWYFSTQEGHHGELLGFEITVDSDKDPCEVYLSDYRDVDGRKMPHKIEIRNGDKTYAILDVTAWKLEAAK